MLRISKMADYATLIMNNFALKPQQVFSAAEIAKQVHITVTTASKILKLLLEDGLVASIRGAGGGYRLARAAEEITIIDVITAIDGRPALTECSGSSLCVQNSVCAVRDNWRIINKVIVTALQNLTLADMSRPLSRHPLVTQGIVLASQIIKEESLA